VKIKWLFFVKKIHWYLDRFVGVIWKCNTRPWCFASQCSCTVGGAETRANEEFFVRLNVRKIVFRKSCKKPPPRAGWKHALGWSTFTVSFEVDKRISCLWARRDVMSSSWQPEADIATAGDWWYLLAMSTATMVIKMQTVTNTPAARVTVTDDRIS